MTYYSFSFPSCSSNTCKVLALLLALIGLAAAECKFDRNCGDKSTQYCKRAKGEKRGVCTTLPFYGEPCGAKDNGLTPRCLSNFQCTVPLGVGCCGKCGVPLPTTTTPATTTPKTTPYNPYASTSSSTTTTFSYGIPIRKIGKGVVCGKYDADGNIYDEVYLKDAPSKNNFVITGFKSRKDCSKNGTCWAKCRRTYGYVFSGTVRVRCTPNDGWQVLGRCKIRYP